MVNEQFQACQELRPKLETAAEIVVDQVRLFIPFIPHRFIVRHSYMGYIMMYLYIDLVYI